MNVERVYLYANIIKVNDEIFRPTYSTSAATAVLSTFISWLNLDLGIVTCFYDGMSVRGKMWAFPAYIFTLVGAIVLVGRYSTRVSRLCRHNVVPVMATLILMSYTKLLKMSIITSSSVQWSSWNTTAPLVTNLVWRFGGNTAWLFQRWPFAAVHSCCPPGCPVHRTVHAAHAAVLVCSDKASLIGRHVTKSILYEKVGEI